MSYNPSNCIMGKRYLHSDIRVMKEDFNALMEKNVALVQRYCRYEFKSKIIKLVNILRLLCKFEVDVN